MARDRAWFERAASSENAWVRARMLDKKYADHPEQPKEIAERAARLAKNNLGERHPAYGIALLNLGIYYAALEGDAPKAEEHFTKARAVLGDDDLEVAESSFRLAVFFFERKRDFAAADRRFAEALAIRRRALDDTDLAVADCLIGLAYAKVQLKDFASAASLMDEALGIQMRLLSPNDPRVEQTASMLEPLKQYLRGGRQS